MITTMEMLQNWPDLTNIMYSLSCEISCLVVQSLWSSEEIPTLGRSSLGVFNLLLKLWLCSIEMLSLSEKTNKSLLTHTCIPYK